METLVNLFTVRLSGILSKEMIIFIISLIPTLELRGGLLAASLMKVPYLKALLICIIGNIVPVPFILLFIRKIVDLMEKFPLTRGIAGFLRRKVEKNRESIEKYGFWGLTLFVGIPLPGTGAWTGCLAAGLLRMDLKKSVPSILLGVLLASAIMSVLSYGLIGSLI